MVWYRAVYKLRGTERGLNFPLTAAEKAELDSMSVPELLAKMELEKEQGTRSRITGASKFQEVHRQGSNLGTKEANGTQGIPERHLHLWRRLLKSMTSVSLRRRAQQR